ncbi:MAG TPA: sugar phosphorylase [Anaerolineales bacterium]|nr:sugar phosphorylase [Anaerolineales bacterium]
MMNTARIRKLLAGLYGQDAGATAFNRLSQILENYNVRLSTTSGQGLDQRDTFLITYPDQLQRDDRRPLVVLADFCRAHLKDTVTNIHILPFYPWTSDDGFSVVDYREVDPRYGDWNDIQRIGQDFRLMFDAVINHASVKNAWFQSMLAGDAHYRDYFITPSEADDLSKVVRPRALPLLTTFQTTDGDKKIWTTFSADQVDLNYAQPNVLLEILDVLLFYVSHGAEFLRLDAIAYLWKEAGTTCIHLPQTHAIIQLIRAVLDEVAPYIMLITETNVPHADNISYFGDGKNEAHMVYNFSLPPLVLHAFQTGSAETLSHWADDLEIPSPEVTFFNFLASHDGIGLNPLRGILAEDEIDAVVERIRSHGGLVSLKNEADGTPRPYELNINYFDALNDPYSNELLDTQVDRFITAHAILLAMRGAPAIYFHSLVGSRSWREEALASGHNRTINRRKLEMAELNDLLSDPSTLPARVFQRLGMLLKIRRSQPAFHPYGSQEVIQDAAQVFCLLRTSPDGKDKALCLQNVSDQEARLDHLQSFSHFTYDLIENKILDVSALSLKSYQTMWLVEPED